MSYILDALKKSEEKRTQEKNATVLHPHTAAPPPIIQKSSQPTSWILPSLLILFVGGGIFLFLSKTNIEKPASPPPPPLSTTSTPKKTTPQAATKLEEKKQPEIKIVPELKAGSKKKVARQQPPEQKEVLQPEPIISDGKPVPLTLPPPPPEALKIPFLEEMPDQFSQSVPEFKLAGHVYSPDPSLRLILINSIIARENDIVEQQFILDEILPDGIILRKGDVKFRLAAD